MRKYGKSLFLLLLSLSLVACAQVLDRIDPSQRGRLLAKQHQWQEIRIQTNYFEMVVFHNGLKSAAKNLTLYIEGDGRAFVQKYRVSDDPTPWQPTALKLAVKDSGQNVAYLARPCQYLSGTESRGCHPKYWTSHRYSREVLDATNEVIAVLKQKAGAESIGLVGFSGGGTIAALLAAERTDIAWFATVAGLLSIHEFSQHHQISRLSGSLDPLAKVALIAAIPQFHLLGEDDTRIPFSINQAFLAKISGSTVKHYKIVPHSHGCCWEKAWPLLLCENVVFEIPQCQS